VTVQAAEEPQGEAIGRAPASRPPWAPGQARLLRIGRHAWATLGIAGVLALAWWLAGLLAVVVVPLLLALFPAALLSPAVGWLNRHRWPRPLATMLVVLAAVAIVGGLLALVVPAFLTQLPALTQSLNEAGSRVDVLIHRVPGVEETATAAGLIRRGVLAFLGGVNAALLAGLNLLLGLLLVLVLLALYLNGGSRMVDTATRALPARWRPDARELLDRLWASLGSYTRALFLVAAFDSTAIAVGLWLLDVPLVLPLAMLVFFGAFIPYIGALLSGLFAVLVALADDGLGTAVGVLVLVLVVQQIDGNVVQPLVVGRAVHLSVFTVVVAVGIGATLLGVLGAFLAVPAAACIAQAVTFLRARHSPNQGEQP
jgi:predicted PurR-regulated permease PerM